MVSPTDPNEVRMTGENSFIRLHIEVGGPMTTRSSHWRVLHSPGGAGHVLFLKSDLTNDEVKVYSDNIALARWLQEEIESMLFPEFANENIPVIPAEFVREGDTFTYCTEIVESAEEQILLTWHDFLEPFMITVPPGAMPGRTHGVYSCFIPAQRAQLTLNSIPAQGVTLLQDRDGRQSSSSVLAWSETWVRPYAS